ncbi:alcohol dehydrogenase-13 [Coleophoma cylindrospora]|uniref:Alcohol dehydrogenase-13 n=1 Tax=Coleophoma cylindrospora TaxID=1849047 RepID=A0A3D8Q8B2_9HELO|nr:alcohol dehydrogenase-13 [Coleophoma cylindrospora]
MATMKAIKLVRESPELAPKILLETVAKPELIDNHVLVKVHASAVHPSDVLNALGGFGITKFPRIPGRDFSGVITEGPPDRIGEEVYGTSGSTYAFSQDGFHAEYCLVHEDAVVPKPKSLSFTQAACIGVPFTTAALTLRKAKATPSDTVMVLGASGAVGSAAVQLAKSQCCRVIKVSRSDESDINSAKDPELASAASLTENHGVDVVVDTVGQPGLTGNAVKRLAQGGRMAFITAPRTGSTELSIDMLQFYRDEKTLVGCNTLKYSVQELAAQMKAMKQHFDNGHLKGAAEGEWTAVKLENAVGAYENAINKRSREKYVIVMD